MGTKGTKGIVDNSQYFPYYKDFYKTEYPQNEAQEI